MDRYDCVIIGAGPGGSTFARNSARKGLKTLLIEKESLPRNKACGGALSPAIRHLFDFDHDTMVERVVRGITFFSRDESEDRTFYPDGMAVEMVSRKDFDNYLVRRAVDAGTTLAEKTRVISVKESKEYVTVSTDGGDMITASIVVGADGARSVVAGNAGLAKEPGGLGFEVEVYPRDRGVLEEYGDRSIFGFGFIPKGYGWIFPKKDHFSVGIGTTRNHMPGITSLYRQFTSRFSFLKEGCESDRRGWFIPYTRHSGPLNTRRILLVGDSARLADPFSGEGIYYAVLSGTIAAQTVFEELQKQGRLSRAYTKIVTRNIIKDFTYARLCSDIFYTAPSFFYRRNRVIRALTMLSNKEIGYRDILKELRKNGNSTESSLSL